MQLIFSCIYFEFHVSSCIMSKLKKLIEKLLNSNSSFTYQELEYLLGKFNYDKKKTGKTSGSRVAFIRVDSKHIIRIHKPHPGNELKKYVKKYIIVELKKEGLI